MVAFGFHVYPGGGEIGDYRRALRQRGEELTREGVTLRGGRRSPGPREAFEAPPSAGLAELANRVGARLIVVGTRGEGRIAGMVLGSTLHKLLHRSSVSLCCSFRRPGK